ncbi:MAG: hypothetical protein WDN31_02015 [Hyphomicrobium sp.]
MIRTIAFLAAIAVMPTLAIALAPPAPHLGPSLIVQASQSIDSCYKKCFLDAKGEEQPQIRLQPRLQRQTEEKVRGQVLAEAWQRSQEAQVVPVALLLR